jgi:hypothetical protein
MQFAVLNGNCLSSLKVTRRNILSKNFYHNFAHAVGGTLNI